MELDQTTAPEAEKTVKTRFWHTMKKALSRIPFLEDVATAYFCAMDPETPARVRYTLLAALLYFVTPLDAIPDIIAGIGFTDDAGILMAAIAAVKAHMTPAHRLAARKALEEHTDDDTEQA